MTNSELAKEILKWAEENHINLYHSISKEKFYKKFNKFLQKADKLSDVQFDYNMMKLFALFKDGHTDYKSSANSLYLDKTFLWNSGELWLLVDDKYYLVNRINGVKVKKLVKKIGQTVSSETKEFKQYEINKKFNQGYMYIMLNLSKGEPLSVNCMRDKNKYNFKVNLITREEVQNATTKKKKSYKFEILNDDILFIRFRNFKEDPEYSINQFKQDILECLKNHKVKGYIFDIRFNTGGTVWVALYVTKFIKKLKIPGVVLINNGVFSAGILATCSLKKSRALLIGQPTGGALGTYGGKEKLIINGKEISVCTEYFDKEHEFITTQKGYDGTKDKNYGKPIKPDIYVPLSVKDLETDTNRALLTAIDYINKQSSK